MFNELYKSMGYPTARAMALNDATIMILSGEFIVFILGMIALWRMFAKAGQPGGKAFIPVYNIYTLCKLTGKTKYFWIQVVLAILTYGFAYCQSFPLSKILFGICTMIAAIAGLVFVVIGNYKISVSYGHGIGFAIGLIVFPFIFMMILGFGKSEYKNFR